MLLMWLLLSIVFIVIRTIVKATIKHGFEYAYYKSNFDPDIPDSKDNQEPKNQNLRYLH